MNVDVIASAFFIYVFLIQVYFDKAVTKKEGPNFFLAVPKMMSLLQLAAKKKRSFLVYLARKFFGSSYFVTALIK